MNSKLKLVAIIGCFVFLIAGSSFIYNKLVEKKLEEERSIQEISNEVKSEDNGNNDAGESAEIEAVLYPKVRDFDFTVYDINENPVKLTDLVGKPIILNFWGSWCPPCRAEMPHFQTMYEEIGEDVNFVMVSYIDDSQETIDTASSFIEEGGYKFPIYFDMTAEAIATYKISAFPSTFFIDEEGNIVDSVIGGLSEEYLRENISKIYKTE